jgi:uncharacterized membrane protein YqjE
MDIALSLAVLTMFALVLGAIALFKRDGYRRQAILMLVLAAILAGNVAIWAVPTPDGQSLVDAPRGCPPRCD